jgi:hypothetical protein
MPVGTRGTYFFTISHLEGLALALYATGPLLALFALLSLVGKINATRVWFLPLSIFSFALSIIVALGAVEILDQRRSMNHLPPAAFGLGAYALLIGHAVVIMASVGLKAMRPTMETE